MVSPSCQARGAVRTGKVYDVGDVPGVQGLWWICVEFGSFPSRLYQQAMRPMYGWPRAAFTAGPRGRKAEIRGSHPSCREPSGLLPMRQWSPGTGLTPAAELGAVAARCEHRRPCHPRATSSGHERYPADNLGHSKRSLSGLPAPDLGVRGGPKLHGMQGGSIVSSWAGVFDFATRGT